MKTVKWSQKEIERINDDDLMNYGMVQEFVKSISLKVDEKLKNRILTIEKVVKENGLLNAMFEIDDDLLTFKLLKGLDESDFFWNEAKVKVGPGFFKIEFCSGSDFGWTTDWSEINSLFAL